MKKKVFLLFSLLLVRSLSLLASCTSQCYYLAACRCSCTVIWQQINRFPSVAFGEILMKEGTVWVGIHWQATFTDTYMATFLSDRPMTFIVTVWVNSCTIGCWMILVIHKWQRGDTLGAWVNGFWHLTLRRLMSYIYIYIYIWSTHSWCF